MMACGPSLIVNHLNCMQGPQAAAVPSPQRAVRNSVLVRGAKKQARDT